MEENEIAHHANLAGKPSLLQWFIVISAAVFVGNITAFVIEKMIEDRQGISNETKQTSIDTEARKVLQSLGVSPPAIGQNTVDPAVQAEQKRNQLIAAKAECDTWTQKLMAENSAVNRMSKNRACQQVSQFMNQLEAAGHPP